ELYLIGCHVPAYQPKNIEDYSPERPRKLLLKKKEIDYLIGKSRQGGLTLIPLKVYTSKALIKVEIGVAKGKKLVDKREGIKKREIDRNLKRSLKL
ncbi:MAG: SsrA-binding protein, partial [Candidatus Pacebacteria bacterium]|nr:SsrA-binding protein [Candidatus Paceibacterota bacterium]